MYHRSGVLYKGGGGEEVRCYIQKQQRARTVTGNEDSGRPSTQTSCTTRSQGQWISHLLAFGIH